MEIKTIVSIIIVGILGFVGSKITLARWKELPFSIKHLLFSKIEYIFLGFLLGPYVTNLLNQELLSQLNPLISLVLGWIGILFGMSFQWKRLKLLPFYSLTIAFIEGGFTFTFVLTGIWLVMQTDLYYFSSTVLLMALAATAAGSTPSCIALLRQEKGLGIKDIRPISFISSLDSIVGLAAMGLCFAFFHPSTNVSFLSGIMWCGLTVFLGLILGILYYFLIVRGTYFKELRLMTIGMVIFSSGLASYFHLSPLVVNFIMGITAANLPSLSQEKVHDMLAETEKPLYIVFLIFLGAMVRVESYIIIIFVILYIVLRIAAKFTSVYAASTALKVPPYSRHNWGLALSIQGGMTLALGLSIQLGYGKIQGAEIIVSTVVIAVIINQIVGAILTKKVVSDMFEKND